MTFHVYKCYSQDDILLYVGQTENVERRCVGHKYLSPWYKDVDRMDVIKCRTRNGALKKEKFTIRQERPLHNVRHNQPVYVPPTPIIIPREFDHLIIDALGGITVVRHLLCQGTEVIAKWHRRGIPVRVKLKMSRKYHYAFQLAHDQIASELK